MRNILLITCFLVTLTVFSQQENVVSKDSVAVPTSIFAAGSLNYQQNNGKISPLRLIGYKFLIVDNSGQHFNSGNLRLDFRNFGRSASYEDINDNLNKAELYKFDVSKNTDHYIWNISWANKQLQKQLERQNRNQ